MIGSLLNSNCRGRSGAGLLSIVVISLTVGLPGVQAFPQNSTIELEAKLRSQYATIEKTIARPPRPIPYQDAADYRKHLRLWQDDLAQTFVAAANTVKEILKLNPPNADYWRERLETLDLYSQPISS